MGLVTPPRKRLWKCSELSSQAKEVDHFLRLSDDIIVFHILSRLSTKEAVRTSVLSHRWQKLWADGLGPNLEFSYLQGPYDDIHLVCKLWGDALRRGLARGINRILKAYNKPTIDKLSIRFDFHSSSAKDIDSWVEYGLRKGVARLELDFSPWALGYPRDNYAFPGMEKLSNLHALCDSSLHPPVRCTGMRNLRVVCLIYVNVSSEIIDFILSNCPIERLCVWHSMIRKKITVSEKSSRLKSLEFVRCDNTKIKVLSSNLISLHYSGRVKSLCLLHVPLLSELSIGHNFCRKFLKKGSQNFSYLSQLKKLTLDLDTEAVRESITYPLEFPKLLKLEQLQVKMFGACHDSCLLWPIVLVEAAPYLLRFSVKLTFLGRNGIKIAQQDEYREKVRNAAKQVRHQCLQHIEMRNFRGFSSDVELGERLLGISQSLKTFVVKPYCEPSEKVYRILGRTNLAKEHRKAAKQLASSVPEGAKFVIP